MRAKVRKGCTGGRSVTSSCPIVWACHRGVRVDHFNCPTCTRSRWCYPYPYPTRAENFYPYPTRPAGIPVPVLVAYPYTGWAKKVIPLLHYIIHCTRGITFLAHPVYDYRTISVKPMATGGTKPKFLIRLQFDCECRQVDISRLLGGKLTSSDVTKIDLSRL